jgi:hypothetical protein
MDKYIKRIQTRVRRQGRKVTKQNCRDVYQQVVNTLESPTDTEINTVVETLLQENHPISSPETLDITPETYPDIWQTLSPPEPDQPNLESALTSQEEPQPIQQLSQPGTIAQSDIQSLVSETFANQPQEVKDQITTFAAQHSFENIRQVQDFLDQLRSMEFSLLVKTLQDHFNRRGIMLNTLNDLLLNQQEKDQQERERFFHQSQNLLMTFQQEMETRLSRDGL